MKCRLQNVFLLFLFFWDFKPFEARFNRVRIEEMLIEKPTQQKRYSGKSN